MTSDTTAPCDYPCVMIVVQMNEHESRTLTIEQARELCDRLRAMFGPERGDATAH